MAAQLIGTNCRLRRADQVCSSRAASSLPVPVSPVNSTGIEVWAAWCSSASSRCAAGPTATKSGRGRRRLGRTLQLVRPRQQAFRHPGHGDTAVDDVQRPGARGGLNRAGAGRPGRQPDPGPVGALPRRAVGLLAGQHLQRPVLGRGQQPGTQVGQPFGQRNRGRAQSEVQQQVARGTAGRAVAHGNDYASGHCISVSAGPRAVPDRISALSPWRGFCTAGASTWRNGPPGAVKGTPTMSLSLILLFGLASDRDPVDCQRHWPSGGWCQRRADDRQRYRAGAGRGHVVDHHAPVREDEGLRGVRPHRHGRHEGDPGRRCAGDSGDSSDRPRLAGRPCAWTSAAKAPTR